MACKIYLDFFGETERDYGLTVLVNSESIENNLEVREELFSTLAKLVHLGEPVTLVVESAAPIGELADIYKMVASLTGTQPVIEVLPSGLIPPVEVKMMF